VGVREGDFIIAIQDQDVRWSKHNQIVEKIRSHTNQVKLTLINVKHKNIESERTTDQSDLNKLNEFDKISKYFISTRKSEIDFNNLNGNHIRWPKSSLMDDLNKSTNDNNNNYNDLQNIPKSRKLHQRLFRLPQYLNNHSIIASNQDKNEITNMNENNKLSNMRKISASSMNDEKRQSKYNDTKVKNNRINKSFNSVNNLNIIEAINFNVEDDEIGDRENAIFWQNLKTMKLPFTNTITLGRRFKKNVLKLGIFNSFTSNIESQINLNKKNLYDEIDVNNEAKRTFMNESTKSTNSSTKNVNSNRNLYLSLGRTKQLKKQKKLKKLEKIKTELINNESNQNEPIKIADNKIIYKTI
jgi:hypothetical protein